MVGAKRCLHILLGVPLRCPPEAVDSDVTLPNRCLHIQSCGYDPFIFTVGRKISELFNLLQFLTRQRLISWASASPTLCQMHKYYPSWQFQKTIRKPNPWKCIMSHLSKHGQPTEPANALISLYDSGLNCCLICIVLICHVWLPTDRTVHVH